jgi:L-iditol 2-dehydrogenase
MKAARVHEPGKIVVEEVPLPQLGESDVLIKVHRVGICGTDIDVMHGHIPVKFPITPGHEYSGTIAKLGSPSLGGLKEGEPVTSTGGWGCGTCDFCQKGMRHFCKGLMSLGRTVDGCMAEFVKVNYRAVYRVPPQVSYDEAACFLNIANTVSGFKKIPLQLGKRVAIFGAGNMGLLILQILKLAGAYEAVAVDTIDFRLDIAKMFGANHVVNALKEDSVKAILGWYPDGADVVVEATGNPSSFQNACGVIAAKGELLSIGILSRKIKEMDLSFLYSKEPTIYGSKGGARGYQEAIQLLEEKKLQILPMITHRFPLEETPKGFKILEDRAENVLCVVIEPCA